MADQFVLDLEPGAWPMTERELEELRWYLEDYLRAPFGVNSERGAAVAASLPDWGARIFAAAFASERARTGYRALRARERSGRCRLVLRSAEPARLGLPWELLRDPASPVPEVLDGVELTRALPGTESVVALPGAESAAPAARSAGSRLRILIVIARPGGTDDVAYRTIARPLMRTLSGVRDQVDVVVLRPSTVDALQRALAAAADAGEPFHVVHFDGHGYQPGTAVRADAAEFFGPVDQAAVVFESPGGGAHYVSAAALGRVLGDAGTPLVILNACQSAAIGTHLEASVATGLLAAGVPSVVAMAFSVYAAAAAGFTAAFYASLFAGESVAAAVANGRIHLHRDDRRPSPRGPLPLADWMLPVHYVRQDVVFPELQPEAGGQLRADPSGFIGRDDLFFEVEAAVQRREVMLLRGPAGVGKTEAARAFSTWAIESSLVAGPARVVWHSTAAGAVTFGLDGIVTGLGIRLLGPDVAVMPAVERRATVLRSCADDPAMLVWDNVETATDADAADTRRFLADLAATGSVVLLTSRSTEQWLGDVHRLTVTGLTREEADEYADQLTAGSPAALAHRADPAYAALTDWLGGHPLTMRTVLPHLATTPAAELLADLRTLSGRFADPDGPLTAGFAYSLGRLAPDVRSALYAVSLLRTVADLGVLSVFSDDATSERFAGIGVDGWRDHLDAAVDAGLAGVPLGGISYPLHPALVGHLRAAWQAENPDAFAAEETAAAEAMTDACAAACQYALHQIAEGDAEFAHVLLGRNRHTFGHYLGRALETGRWEAADALFRGLNERWSALGLGDDAERWIDRISAAVDDGGPVSGDAFVDGATRLRMLADRRRALRAISRRDFAEAEQISRRLIATAEDQPPSRERDFALASYYHDLGMIFYEQTQWDEAETWFRRSVTLDEAIDERQGAGTGYLMLGNLLADRGRLDEAVAEFRRCAAVAGSDVGFSPLRASAEHGLGMVALMRNDLAAAERAFLRVLTAAESTDDRPRMASALHQLGSVAVEDDRLDDAERWLVRALGLAEELGEPEDLLRVYGTLGRVAEERDRRDQAAQWYRRAIDLALRIGDHDSAVTGYLGVGRLLRADGNLDDAEDFARLALTTAEAIEDRTGASVALSDLSGIAQTRGALGEAAGYSRQALAILEAQGNRRSAARVHVRLAEIAAARADVPGAVREYERAIELQRETGALRAAAVTAGELADVFRHTGDLDGADRWARIGYRDATTAGDRESVLFTAGVAGLIAAERGDAAGQLEWYVRAVTQFDRFPHPSTGNVPDSLRRLSTELGIAAVERAWRAETGDALPDPVRAYLSPPGRHQ